MRRSTASRSALGRYMENVGVFVEDQRHPNLLGLYQGIPLTHRAAYGAPYNGLPMPDRITIFRLPICRICRDEADVIRQVRVTVVHEVAHHFGIDDDSPDRARLGLKAHRRRRLVSTLEPCRSPDSCSTLTKRSCSTSTRTGCSSPSLC